MLIKGALTKPRTTKYGSSHLSVSRREFLEELSCFLPGQTISGDNNRDEVLALFKTGLQVLLLFVTLMRSKDLVVGDRMTDTTWYPYLSRGDVSNDVGHMGPEASDEKI
jgi:hypothetical protein